MFVVSRGWLQRFARGPAGWSKKQVQALGVEYPLSSGWIDRIVGQEISDDARTRFETLHAERASGGNGLEGKKHPRGNRRKKSKRAVKQRHLKARNQTNVGRAWNDTSPLREGEKVWFGLHKGKRWDAVPKQYLEWCMGSHSHESARVIARRELERRAGERAKSPPPESYPNDGCMIADEFIVDHRPFDGLAPWEPWPEEVESESLFVGVG